MVVYVTQNVQIEAAELHGIVHNGFLTSEAIAAASREVEAAVTSAAGALNGTRCAPLPIKYARASTDPTFRPHSQFTAFCSSD